MKRKRRYSNSTVVKKLWCCYGGHVSQNFHITPKIQISENELKTIPNLQSIKNKSRQEIKDMKNKKKLSNISDDFVCDDCTVGYELSKTLLSKRIYQFKDNRGREIKDLNINDEFTPKQFYLLRKGDLCRRNIENRNKMLFDHIKNFSAVLACMIKYKKFKLVVQSCVTGDFVKIHFDQNGEIAVEEFIGKTNIKKDIFKLYEPPSEREAYMLKSVIGIDNLSYKYLVQYREWPTMNIIYRCLNPGIKERLEKHVFLVKWKSKQIGVTNDLVYAIFKKFENNPMVVANIIKNTKRLYSLKRSIFALLKKGYGYKPRRFYHYDGQRNLIRVVILFNFGNDGAELFYNREKVIKNLRDFDLGSGYFVDNDNPFCLNNYFIVWILFAHLNSDMLFSFVKEIKAAIDRLEHTKFMFTLPLKYAKIIDPDFTKDVEVLLRIGSTYVWDHVAGLMFTSKMTAIFNDLEKNTEPNEDVDEQNENIVEEPIKDDSSSESFYEKAISYRCDLNFLNKFKGFLTGSVYCSTSQMLDFDKLFLQTRILLNVFNGEDVKTPNQVVGNLLGKDPKIDFFTDLVVHFVISVLRANLKIIEYIFTIADKISGCGMENYYQYLVDYFIYEEKLVFTSQKKLKLSSYRFTQICDKYKNVFSLDLLYDLKREILENIVEKSDQDISSMFHCIFDVLEAVYPKLFQLCLLCKDINVKKITYLTVLNFVVCFDYYYLLTVGFCKFLKSISNYTADALNHFALDFIFQNLDCLLNNTSGREVMNKSSRKVVNRNSTQMKGVKVRDVTLSVFTEKDIREKIDCIMNTVIQVFISLGFIIQDTAVICDDSKIDQKNRLSIRLQYNEMLPSIDNIKTLDPDVPFENMINILLPISFIEFTKKVEMKINELKQLYVSVKKMFEMLDKFEKKNFDKIVKTLDPFQLSTFEKGILALSSNPPQNLADFSQMGTGKTRSKISLSYKRINDVDRSTFTVVLPANLLDNWTKKCNDIDKKCGVKMTKDYVFRITKAVYVRTLKKMRSKVLLMSYDTFLSILNIKYKFKRSRLLEKDRTFLKFLEKSNFFERNSGTVLDEIHSNEDKLLKIIQICKDNDNTSKFFRGLILMSGTPYTSVNMIKIVCTLLNVDIKNEENEFNKLENFVTNNNQLEVPAKVREVLLGVRNKMKGKFIYRPLIPESGAVLNIFYVYPKMTKMQAQIYTKSQESKWGDLFDELSNFRMLLHPYLFYLGLQKEKKRKGRDWKKKKLFKYVKNLENIENYENSNKTIFLVNMINGCKKQSRKLIFASRYVISLEGLKDLLIEWNIVDEKLCFMVTEKDKQDKIDEFEEHNGFAIAFLPQQSGGTGFDIITCSLVVLLNPHWEPSLEVQTYFRVYRRTQRHSCSIFLLTNLFSYELEITKRSLKREYYFKFLLNECENLLLKFLDNKIKTTDKQLLNSFNGRDEFLKDVLNKQHKDIVVKEKDKFFVK